MYLFIHRGNEFVIFLKTYRWTIMELSSFPCINDVERVYKEAFLYLKKEWLIFAPE